MLTLNILLILKGFIKMKSKRFSFLKKYLPLVRSRMIKLILLRLENRLNWLLDCSKEVPDPHRIFRQSVY